MQYDHANESPPPSGLDLATGQEVGEYVVESKIGEGGFGTVFRASHPLIGKLAAIKVLSRQYSADPEMVSRFVAEARAVNQIRHRNIIDIFAFGQLDDGRSYYVMELLDGEPLSKRLELGHGTPLAEALPILRAIARALDAAHAKGIAHRDLKPENVFLVREPDDTVFPKLLDFGIAKLLGNAGPDTKHKTRTGAPIGTPYYMSPEQARGRDVDHRTDIYAFGCVAYTLLTGAVPFDGDDHLEILVKQISDEPVPPSIRAAENPALPLLPEAVDTAIGWMMRKEPADRPATLAAAMRALEEAAGIEPVPLSARTPSAMTPVPSRRSQQPIAVASDTLAAPPRRRTVTIALIGTVIAALAGAVWFATRADDAPAAVNAPVVATVPDAGPHLVTIRIEGAPANTRVFGPAGPLGRAPGEIRVMRGSEELQLTLIADGFEDGSARITPAADQTIAVTLTPVPAPAPAVVTAPTGKKPGKTVSKARPRPKTPPVATPKPTPTSDPYSRK